ncbi:MAG: APC family permease [Methylotenera sp.]|nr:APC family permease [Oligoflexia bacterium]
MGFERLKRLILGDPLSNEMAVHEHLPKWKALAVLSSDALSSVAYATEEILIPLSLFAVTAVAWSLPIALAIAALLIIITISYRQTIDAYPGGGGAYTVAKENLGVKAGLVAAASLLIDYVLTVAVSIAAGVENIAAAFPALASHKEGIGLICILIVMLFNLRGVKESASVFAIPTYFFVLSIVTLIGVGSFKLMMGIHIPVAPVVHEVYPAIPVFLLLRAFSSGCSALTGIEAISNGIPLFKDPKQKNAKATMLWMGLILGSLFLGITLLCHLYGIIPSEGETAISLLSKEIFGKQAFYYVIQASTALILLLAANTSYADFPRLASLLAKDGFLPRQLAILGDRLVFSNGILGLSLASMILIVVFKGDTHLLIPLYAVGVFLSFTLSQTGMVIHHLRHRESHWIKSLVFNFLGAVTTFIVFMVIGMTKFMHGAWVVVLLIPCMVFFFFQIKKHYLHVATQLSGVSMPTQGDLEPLRHTAIVPISGLHPGVIKALRYAVSISDDVRACYVELNPEATQRLKAIWDQTLPQIPFIVLKSPYRSVISPLLDYIDDVEKITHDEVITVIIPEFVTSKWYHQFLHNQTALFLRAALRFRRGKVVTSVRYHLQ